MTVTPAVGTAPTGAGVPADGPAGAVGDQGAARRFDRHLQQAADDAGRADERDGSSTDAPSRADAPRDADGPDKGEGVDRGDGPGRTDDTDSTDGGPDGGGAQVCVGQSGASGAQVPVDVLAAVVPTVAQPVLDTTAEVPAGEPGGQAAAVGGAVAGGPVGESAGDGARAGTPVGQAATVPGVRGTSGSAREVATPDGGTAAGQAQAAAALAAPTTVAPVDAPRSATPVPAGTSRVVAAQLLAPAARLAAEVVPGEGPTELQIRLNPLHLGEVVISCRVDGDRATISLTAARQPTADALAAAARELERGLAATGLTVEVRPGSSSMGGGSHGAGHQGDGEREAATAVERTRDAVPRRGGRARTSTARDGGVDTYM